MRIIFVNRFFAPDLSATSLLLSDLAFHLAAQGMRVEVICSRRLYHRPAEVLSPREDIRGVQVHRAAGTGLGRAFLPLRTLDYLSFLAHAMSLLRHLARPGDVVVAKTDPPMLSVPVSRALAGRGVILVNWLQDLFPEVAMALGLPGLRGAPGRGLRRLRNRSLCRAAMNVVLGQGMKEMLERQGIPARRLRVIANWADGTRLAPMDPAEIPERGLWGLKQRFVVGYSGNLGRAHEHHTLLEAATILDRQPQDAHPPAHFLCIGGGSGMEALRREARQRDLGNISFHAYLPLERLCQGLNLADAHLVILRPDMEGLIVPSKFYGIAAVGRPCLFVGHPRGEIARLVRGHGCGLCVETGQAWDLARAINALRRNPDQQQAMGHAARTMFTRHFDAPMAHAAWQELLGSLAGEAGSRHSLRG